MINFTESCGEKSGVESLLFLNDSLPPSSSATFSKLSSSAIPSQPSSSKSLIEDPLSCVVDSRQDTSGMTLLSSGVKLSSTGVSLRNLQKRFLNFGNLLSTLKASSLHTLKIIFTAFSLLSLTAVANEPTPLYQQLITSAQQYEVMTEDENKALIVVSKRLAERNKVEPLAPLDVAPFHFRSAISSGTNSGISSAKDEKPPTENNSGLCASCHDQQAHSKSVKLRSFLNMHTKTIACQTCHFTSDEYQLAYQWKTATSQLVKQIDFADKKDHLLVPVYQGKPIVPSKNSAFVKDLMAQWQQAEKAVDRKQQALLWQSIHKPLKPQLLSSKEESNQQVSCTSCHQQTDPRINLAELGADKQRQQRFEQNIIARFFKRYRKEDDKINLLELLK